MLFLVYKGLKGITSLSVFNHSCSHKRRWNFFLLFFSYLTFTHLEKGKTVLQIRDPDRIAPPSREVVGYTIAFYLQYRGVYTVTIDSILPNQRQ